MAVLDRAREIEYTQKQIEMGQCTTKKVSKEELQMVLDERGKSMGKRGPQKGAKYNKSKDRDKRINGAELADQDTIHAAKKPLDERRRELAERLDSAKESTKDKLDMDRKPLAAAARANIEVAIANSSNIFDDTVSISEKLDPIKDWDMLAAQTKGAVLQERANANIESQQALLPKDRLEDLPDAIRYALGQFSVRPAGDRDIIKLTKVNAMDVNQFKKMLHESNIGVHMMPAGGEGEFIDQLKPDEIKIEDYLDEGAIKGFMHESICRELNKLYVAKNHDYGDSFSETYRKLGIISAVTRISDKVNRLQSLCTREQKIHDESMRDTLRDLANYAIMTIMEMEAQG